MFLLYTRFDFPTRYYCLTTYKQALGETQSSRYFVKSVVLFGAREIILRTPYKMQNFTKSRELWFRHEILYLSALDG